MEIDGNAIMIQFLGEIALLPYLAVSESVDEKYAWINAQYQSGANKGSLVLFGNK